MEALAKQKTNVKLRKIDIVTWRSAAAKQFNVRQLPTLWLYDGKKRVSTDIGDVFQRVSKLD